MTGAVDLSQLQAPDVVVQMTYADILSAMLADLQTKDPDLALLVSDPAYKILEVAAYREALIRQETNDRARGLLLAYAVGSDLDHIGVTYFHTQRLVINAGDANAVPPVDPTYESDSDYRSRLLIAEDAYSTAGPDVAYIYYAKSADGNVKDISIASPNPVEVLVTVLSRVGDGTPDAALITAVDDALGNDVRPLTDQVTVQAATIVNYTVNATLTVYAGVDQATVQAAVEASLTTWVDEQHLLGRDITVAGLNAAMKIAGVHDVLLNNTVGTDIIANLAITDTQAAYCSGTTVTVGGVGN